MPCPSSMPRRGQILPRLIEQVFHCGDPHRVYCDGRGGPWRASLDKGLNLARRDGESNLQIAPGGEDHLRMFAVRALPIGYGGDHVVERFRQTVQFSQVNQRSVVSRCAATRNLDTKPLWPGPFLPGLEQDQRFQSYQVTLG